MYVCSFLLTALFPDPRLFLWPVVVSFAAVLAAAVCFTHFAAAAQCTTPLSDSSDSSDSEENVSTRDERK